MSYLRVAKPSLKMSGNNMEIAVAAQQARLLGKDILVKSLAPFAGLQYAQWITKNGDLYNTSHILLSTDL